MSILDVIRNMFWQRAMKKSLAGRQRRRTSASLHTAKDVFVIYDASEEEQNRDAEDLFNKLKGIGIKIKSLGYAKYKIVPHYCIPQLTKQFICRQDIDWKGIPRKSFLQDFLDEEFDLLISLDMAQDRILQYIAAMSAARFKVGWNDPANLPYFDFLIGSKPGDIHDFIRQILHYLSISKT